MCIVINNSAGESEGGKEPAEKEEGAAEREGHTAEKEGGAAEKREGEEGEEAARGTSSKEAKNGYVNHVIITSANL